MACAQPSAPARRQRKAQIARAALQALGQVFELGQRTSCGAQFEPRVAGELDHLRGRDDLAEEIARGLG
jgi:hypothetical protein